MKRFLIISFCLLLVGLALRWLFPQVIYSALSNQLASHNIELKCLDWHLSGFQQLTIDQLCLSYQSIDANISNATVTLMQGEVWSASNKTKSIFNWKNLVPAVDVVRMEILLPEKVELASNTDKSAQQNRNKNVADIARTWLPDIKIQQLHISSADEGVPPLGLTLDLQQKKSQRVLKLTSSGIPEPLSVSITQDQQSQHFELEWQLDLPGLYNYLQNSLPLLVAEPDFTDTRLLSNLTIRSGKTSGKLNMAINNPLFFKSEHQINDLEVELSHEMFATPLTVHLDEEFELWREDDTINFHFARDGKTTLSDISSISNHLLEKHQWQGLQASLPDAGDYVVSMPPDANLTFNQSTGNIALIEADAIAIKGDNQLLQFNDIRWTADTHELNSEFQTRTQIILSNINPYGSNSTTFPVAIQLIGDVKGNAKEGVIGLKSYAISGTSVFAGKNDSIPKLPEYISWQDTQLMGSGILNWRQNGLNIVTEYLLGLTNVQAGPVFFDEINSKGNLELIDQNLNAIQTLSVSPDITLTVNASGTLDEMNINAELPTTELNLITPIIQQLEPLFSLYDGDLSADFSTTLLSGKLDQADINLKVNHASISWQDYHVSDVNTEIPLTLNSSLQLIAQPKKLTVAQLNTGAIINNLQSQFLIAGKLSEPSFQLQQLSGEVFHGSFSLAQLNYPLSLNNDALLRIDSFDLNEVVNLFGDQGIEVTGSISGDIPLSFSEGLVSIEQAMVKADGDGRLRIENNAGFQSLKNSQETLGLALSLLADLNYTTLQSEVHLEPDGDMTLKVNIAGINQKEQQPINFNPTLTTNLYTGLKALRAGQNIAGSIEQKLDQ